MSSRASLIVVILIAAVGLSACSDESDSGALRTDSFTEVSATPQVTETESSETSTSSPSPTSSQSSASAPSRGLDAQPAAAEMRTGNTVGVTSLDGETSNLYRLGTVDYSTYSPSGLSWISDDRGLVPGGVSGLSSGKTLIFFIDGKQVPQPVAVADIAAIKRNSADSVTVNYQIRDCSSCTGRDNPVTFVVDGGKLSTEGDLGQMSKALIWNTDISY